jgi:FAD-dependent urate hydroxylase
MVHSTNLLIIGAGPFGLAIAAYAQHHQIEHLVVGKPMEFWQAHMPQGMYLRSACDWHLDPLGVHTIEKFLETQGLTPADVEPLSLPFYLSYARWFQEQKHITPTPAYVQQLDVVDGDHQRFRAALDDGRVIRAQHVVVAVGFRYFKHLPDALVARLPAGRYAHSCDLVDFSNLSGKRCLILGGRQSAFETAALLCEAGAAAVHIVHRHTSPAFQQADWSWVNPIVDAIADNPGWFRSLSEQEQAAVNQRLWSEGRLKIEPWLEPRLMREAVKVWPCTQLVACEEERDGALRVQLDNGEGLVVDQIILATGYKVDISQVPFLAAGTICERLATRNGFPMLDKQFQTTLPGLFVTSLAAGQDFGPFFGFTIAVRTSARVIGAALTQHLRAPV